MPSLGSAALPKPMVAVIGDFQDMLGPIESCKARMEFVFLNALPEEPDFWSRSQIKGAVFCGFKWFARFRETETLDELGIVVAAFESTIETLALLGREGPGRCEVCHFYYKF